MAASTHAAAASFAASFGASTDESIFAPLLLPEPPLLLELAPPSVGVVPLPVSSPHPATWTAKALASNGTEISHIRVRMVSSLPVARTICAQGAPTQRHFSKSSRKPA